MTGRTLRFANFLLDTFIYLAFTISIIYIFNRLIEKEMVKWISAGIYFLYYFVFEYFRSQTLGKMITKSKVIQLSENNNYFFIQILARTSIRIIPLDILSYLFFRRGLHDWISKTDVTSINNNAKI